MRHRIRGTEIDASGTMPASGVARLCENTRWEIFGLDDFPLRGAMERGVVRASVFEYLEPMRRAEEIEVSTQLARVGTTSLDFVHALRRIHDGLITTRARVTVVHLGPSGPAPLDPGLRRFVSEGPSPSAAPWPEGERADAWTRDWLVRPSDEDSFGHVNQACYVDYIDDTRRLATLAGAPAGCGGVIQRLQVEYIRETHAGQRVQMESWVTAANRRAFELTRLSSGERLCRGQILCGSPTASS